MYKDIEDQLLSIALSPLGEQYDHTLNDEGEVLINGNEYLPSLILQLVDPVAYIEGFNDYVATISEGD